LENFEVEIDNFDGFPSKGIPSKEMKVVVKVSTWRCKENLGG
jgi:hypothetical protein